MRVKIISTGKAHQTKVIDEKTGEMIEGVTAIDWRINARDDLTEAIITVIDVPVSLVTDATLEKK